MRSAGPAGGDLLARRYRLIDRVGAGGMSVVWRARDEVLDRLVAVKWLGSELADDALFRDLVRREAWATARIKHPAVAAVYDYGEVTSLDGQSLAYVVMEMLDGESLSDRLQVGPVPWREAVAITAEVADALATAHDQSVVHRDISPDNVMLTSSGLRVFDFGIAARIGEPDNDATGSTFGTPAYVAPERLDGRPAQAATDVYAVGVLLFEMLTGAPPFPEDTWNPDAALQDRAAPRPKVPGLPAGVARLCRRCLAYDPAQRPPAREVADRLAAYGGGRRWRARLLAAAAAVVVIAGAGAAVLVAWTPDSPVTVPEARGVSSVPPPSAGPTTAPATTGAPPTTAPAAPPPAPAPTTTTSAPAALTIEQGLDNLRQVIASGLSAGKIRSDVANDFDNQVDAIENTLARSGSTSTEAARLLGDLRTNVRNRSTQEWGPPSVSGAADPGRPAVSRDARDALFAAIDSLTDAVTAP